MIAVGHHVFIKKAQQNDVINIVSDTKRKRKNVQMYCNLSFAHKEFQNTRHFIESEEDGQWIFRVCQLSTKHFYKAVSGCAGRNVHLGMMPKIQCQPYHLGK